ncbi:hypothetical protein MNBD_GAMMA12-3685 [hydrothermal vent metagenome]|uniref:Lipoprotein n=1 Tax=hydrothermal vent metagenome TaxID=652676 RepID=A0A3B0Z869_9ZZZZ
MKKLQLSILLVITMLVTACANVPVVKLNSSTSASLNGKSLVIVNHKAGPFVAFTAGKAGFGLLGVSAMYSAGRAQVLKYGIEDPANSIRTSLVDGLNAEYNLKVIRTEIKALKNKSVSSVLSAYAGKADYILDYRTFEMGYVYYPTKWRYYRVRYLGKFRLFDSKTQKVIAAGSCITLQGDDANPPTKQLLLANNAGLLKKYLTQASTACTKSLSKEILGLK